ncbi:rRNA maturation RNase YbeY [Candidatus Uhrbacteria bacterium]|nr:rRNA maturation RNase YbeY [Candidatus Uhrbacteria bacterium]
MLQIDVARVVPVSLSDVALRAYAAEVVRVTKTKRQVASRELSVAFVGPQRMRTVNRGYHGEDRVTDVLAFSGAPESFGEILICPAYVRQQAKKAKEPVRREMVRVFVHGVLHLLGYDHAVPEDAERMFRIQEAVVRTSA